LSGARCRSSLTSRLSDFELIQFGPRHYLGCGKPSLRMGAGFRFSPRSVFTANRLRAKALGDALRFLAGLIFALISCTSFAVIDQSGWWLGAIFFGPVHAPAGGRSRPGAPREHREM